MSYRVYELEHDGSDASSPESFDTFDDAEQYAEDLVNGRAHRNTATIEIEHWSGDEEPDIKLVRSWRWDDEAAKYIESTERGA